MFGKTLQRFADHAPVCMMVRLAMERALGDDALDQLFRDTATRQYERELLFSAVAGLMIPVVCGSRRSVHEAYRHAADPPAVSITSVYNKLNGVEPGVSAALVRHTARQLRPLVRLMRQDRPSPLLPGYPVRIADARPLHRDRAPDKGTAVHRVGRPPRPGAGGAGPGGAADRGRRAVRGRPRPGAHAGRATARGGSGGRAVGRRPQLLHHPHAVRGGAGGAGAFFLIRFHARSLKWRELGPFRPCGRTDTGRVSEQQVGVCDPLAGRRMTVRRVRLELDGPTEDGETAVLLLTNLPADAGPRAVSAKQAADGYHKRWTIERAFEELTLALRGEVDTLGYPRAAVFAFCVAVAAYNLVALVTAALGAVHGRATVGEQVSGYQLAREWATVYEGMAIAAGPRAWSGCRGLDDAAFVGVLKDLAAAADLRRYRKVRRGPKKKPPRRTSGGRIHHVATARLLALRKAPAATP